MSAPVKNGHIASRDRFTGVPVSNDRIAGGADLAYEQIEAAFSQLLGNHIGAQATALLGGWGPYLADIDLAWKWDATMLANRSWDLVRNDPHARSMVEAVILGVFGSGGLSSRSLYREDDAAATSDSEREIRREINASICKASSGKRLDAGGQLSRKQLGIRFLINKIVTGDGFAVRVWKPNRPNAYQGSAWRIVPFDRVCNADGKPNDGTHWEGLTLDNEGSWIGISIRDTPLYSTDKATWTYFPVYAPDGTRIVLHDFKPFAGERRGLSWFAPLLVLAKHLQQTSSAYVIAKRIQACHPTIIQTDDPTATAAAARAKAVLGPNTRYEPGRTYYISRESDVKFPDWSFNGADFTEFVDSQLRMFTACWGLPFQFVVQQLTKANLASSRAALDGASRTFESMQNDQIDSFEHPINEAIIREDIARKRIIVPVSVDWDNVVSARWLRPRQWSTDRAKDAAAALQMVSLGKSYTSIHAEMGMDFEHEIMQLAQDRAFAGAQGIDLSRVAVAAVTEKVDQPPTAAPVADPNAEDDGDGADVEDEGDQTDDAPPPSESQQ